MDHPDCVMVYVILRKFELPLLAALPGDERFIR